LVVSGFELLATKSKVYIMLIKSYDDLIASTVRQFVDSVNQNLAPFGISFSYSRKHIIQRMKERGLHVQDLRSLLASARYHHLCEILYLTKLEGDTRPFRIEIIGPEIGVMIGRRDDDLWNISTVLDPKIHSKHHDEGILQSFTRQIKANKVAPLHL